MYSSQAAIKELLKTLLVNTSSCPVQVTPPSSWYCWDPPSHWSSQYSSRTNVPCLAGHLLPELATVQMGLLSNRSCIVSSQTDECTTHTDGKSVWASNASSWGQERTADKHCIPGSLPVIAWQSPLSSCWSMHSALWAPPAPARSTLHFCPRQASIFTQSLPTRCYFLATACTRRRCSRYTLFSAQTPSSRLCSLHLFRLHPSCPLTRPSTGTHSAPRAPWPTQQ